MSLNAPEPPPEPNDSTPIWDLVIADMRERDRLGREKYGVPLQAGNGRKPLADAYQETLDQAAYLRQEIEERADGGDYGRAMREVYEELDRRMAETSGIDNTAARAERHTLRVIGRFIEGKMGEWIS